jgi:hypothetical protein
LPETDLTARPLFGTGALFVPQSSLFGTSDLFGRSTDPLVSGYEGEVLADSPLLLWKLDESAGTTAVDSSGNGNDGTYSGTYTLAAASGYPDARSVPYFDGGRVLGNAKITSDATFTIECWFEKDDFKSGQTANINSLIGDLRSTSNGVMVRWDGDVSTLRAYVAGQGTYLTVDASPTLEDHRYHYVLTSNGTHLGVYLNGVQVALVAGAATGFDMTWAAAGIWSGGGQAMYMLGSVGWVAVYPTALSADRVAAHYAAGL